MKPLVVKTNLFNKFNTCAVGLAVPLFTNLRFRSQICVCKLWRKVCILYCAYQVAIYKKWFGLLLRYLQALMGQRFPHFKLWQFTRIKCMRFGWCLQGLAGQRFSHFVAVTIIKCVCFDWCLQGLAGLFQPTKPRTKKGPEKGKVCGCVCTCVCVCVCMCENI